MSKRIFVTGATGHIGTKLIEKLLARGFLVRGMGRRETLDYPPGNLVRPEQLWQHPNFEYHRGDILDKESVEQGVSGCDYVFHLAAYAKNWHRDRNMFDRFNVEGTRNVLEACEKHHVQRLVYTSTIVTLGTTKPGQIGDESMERPSEKTFTDYERTKLQAEREVLQWFQTRNLPVVIVNPTRVFGPGQLSESNSVIVLMDLYNRGRFPFLINFGKNLGNYVSTEDVAEGHILALERGRLGERYILGGDENITLRDIYNYVDEFRGKKGFKFPIWLLWPMIVAYTLKITATLTGIYPIITPGWVRLYSTDGAFSVEKAKRELGYAPMSMREAFKNAYDWMMEIQKQKETRS
ncbi:MAG: SDR family oxidoreductase [Planctomycetia bacterium]|nr:SDR family oxidoreductase [Planctomycetia bacterium]